MSANNAELQSELQSGETVIWSGRPVQMWAHFRTKLGPALFWGVPFTLFPLVLLANMFGYFNFIQHDESKSYYLQSAFFIVILLYAGIPSLFSPLVAVIRAKNTEYLATNRRVMVVSRLFRTEVQSMIFGELGKITRTDSRNGTGDLEFTNGNKPSDPRIRGEGICGFRGIRDPQKVEAIIMKAMVNAQSGGSTA